MQADAWKGILLAALQTAVDERTEEQLLGDLFKLNGDESGGFYGGSGSNLLRESNRVNTAQMVASVQFVRRRRIQNMILGCSAAASLAVVLTMFVV